MRRLLVVAALVGSVATAAQSPRPGVPAAQGQADGVVRLLADLELALASGRESDIKALTSESMPADARTRLAIAAAAGTGTSATVRERARRPLADGFELLTEVLISRDRRGRLTTWQMTVAPREDAPGQFHLTNLEELAALDGLIQLSLDRTRQFALEKFVFRGPDLVLEMPAGTAFVADAGTGVTAIVLRGRGQIRFAPPVPAEQRQLEIFAGNPAYTTEIDTAFIRLSPAEYELRVAEGSLRPMAADAAELRRADAVFDDRAPRSFTLDLRDLGQERWSLEPSVGNAVVEFRTRRHGWLTYAQSPGEPEDISVFDRLRGRNISVYASADKLAQRGPYFSEDDGRAYDVQQADLDVSFDPSRAWVSGRGTLRIRITRPVVSTLTIKLAESLAVSAVTTAEFGRLLSLRVRGQNKLLVSLPQPQTEGTVIAIEIRYSGRLPPQQLDREAIEVQGTPAGQTPDDLLIQPEARFMYSNRTAWYPQNETSDYATTRIRVTVPSEYQVVGSGTFVNSSIDAAARGGSSGAPFQRTVRYASDRPTRYAAIIISRFVAVDRRRVPVPAVALGEPADGATTPSVGLEVVSTPRVRARNRQTADRVAAMLELYARTAGDAPYPDFTLAALDDNLPGGHSPAYFAILHQPLPTSPYSWSADPVSFDHVYPHFFLAHEVAHQWWGQAVGWKNYHEQWLSEGLAQYFALLFAESDRGADVAAALVGRMRESALASGEAGPIYLGYRLGHIKGDSRAFRALVYNKSAVVLHMLRRLMGDEAFTAGLREFYRTWRFRKAGTGDLREALGRHTSLPLDRFFERWIHGADVPRLRVETRLEAGAAVVRVEQTGDVFDLPLLVSVQYVDGRVELHDLKITEATSEHRLPLNGDVRRVEVKDEASLYRLVR